MAETPTKLDPDSLDLLGEGTLTSVWTDGRHAIRPMRPWSTAIHRLLEHLERHDVPKTPRFVRVEGEFEVLTLLPGRAIRRPWPPCVQTTSWMQQVGRWLRRFHDASADFRLAERTEFAWGPDVARAGKVVTHGDLGPWNMLADDGEFAGVIDWDLARFGDPLDDLTEIAFELAPLRENHDMLGDDATDAVIEARIEALCRSYQGVTARDVFDHVVPLYQQRIADISELAAAGEKSFVTLKDAGTIDALRADLRHFRRHARW